MVKQLLNSVCKCLADQLFDLLATDKSGYFV